MSADNHWSGRVAITPPLTWRECRLSPAVEDVCLDIHEEDGPDGKILTAVAVLPARPSNQWGGHTGDELRSLINAHPGHEFTGSLRVDWDPVYGDDQVLAERWSVDGRSVVHEEGRLVWAGEADRWRSAFEALHARLLRDLPGDASELPQPDEKFWADNLDRLLTYADELYQQTEGGEVPDA